MSRRRAPRALLLTLLVLAALDLARPYAGPHPLLLAAQWTAGLAALAFLGGTLRERGRSFRESLPALALAALLLPTYLYHSRNLESDGVNYYAFLRSLLFDLDLDLANDCTLLGPPCTPVNAQPVGAAVLWSPFIVLVHVLWQVGRLLGAPPPQGVEPLYQAAACLGTLVYAAAGLFLLMDALKRWASPAVAFWATVLCWVGSPLRFYLSVMPGFAHGGEFLAAVLVLRTYLALREHPEPRRAAACGLACGFAFLMRSQDAVLLGLPAVELALRLRRDRVGAVRASLVLGGAFLVAALPQVAVWQAMFGTPVLVPHTLQHGAAFMNLAEPQLAGTLLSPRGGLFVNYPAMLLAFAGLLVLALRDGRYVVSVLPSLLLGWYVNSAIFDWIQVRRFTGLVPLLAPGLARALVPLARAGVVVMAVVAFLVLRYDLAVDALRSQPGQPVPARAALVEMGDGLARDAYRILEGVAPRAAVALLGAYTGERFLEQTVSEIDLAGDPGVLRLPQRARGLSEPDVEDGVACRWVRDPDGGPTPEARLFLPLAWQGEVLVTIRARPLETREPQTVTLIWSDVTVERLEMSAAWADYRFHVPRSAVRPGTNVLVLRFDRAPIYRRVRGYGPREVRPAALARVTLHRGEP